MHKFTKKITLYFEFPSVGFKFLEESWKRDEGAETVTLAIVLVATSQKNHLDSNKNKIHIFVLQTEK